MKDHLLFRIHTTKGEEYNIYLSGKIEGFPSDAMITNYAAPLFAKLSAPANRPEVEASHRVNALLAVTTG